MDAWLIGFLLILGVTLLIGARIYVMRKGVMPDRGRKRIRSMRGGAMQVTFLGGHRVKNLMLSDGTKVAVGETTELSPRTISLLRRRGYRFESVDGETLPPPQQEPPPAETVRAPGQRSNHAEVEQEAVRRARAQEEAARQAQAPAQSEPERQDDSEPDTG